MPLESILQAVVPTVLSLGAIAWLIFEKFRSGAGDLRRQIDADNSTRRTQLEESKAELLKELAESENRCNAEIAKMKELHALEISKLYEGLAGLKATLVEKDKHIESLTSILQGRNPEMISLLEEIKAALIENRKLSKEMHEHNKIILDHQTILLEKGEQRSEKIVTASVHGEGEVMRVPEEVAAEVEEKK